MLKTTIITLAGAGALGTGAHTFTPQTVEITAGSIMMEVGGNGFNVDIAQTPDFAVTIKSKDDRQFTVRL